MFIQVLNILLDINKMKNYEEIFTIIVRGDSYYSNRINQLTWAKLKDEMHDNVGLFGNFVGEVIGTEEEIDKRMMEIHDEIDCGDDDFEFGDKQIEEDLVYFEKVSVQELFDYYCSTKEDESILLSTLEII